MYVKKEISYSLKCRKSTNNKKVHKVLMLINLIKQQSSKCKARKSVLGKEYKPDKKQKWFLQIVKTK